MRSYTRIIACCLTALILILPSSGLDVAINLQEDGKTYLARVVLNQTDRYEIVEPGMLGERIPLQVSNLTVSNGTSALSITPDRGTLHLPHGDYVITYEGKVSGNILQLLFPSEGNVTVTLPHPYQVGNPLLTSIQPRGADTVHDNTTTQINWEKVRSVELRYYDEQQEMFLYIFGQFWLIIAVLLLIPFFLARR